MLIRFGSGNDMMQRFFDKEAGGVDAGSEGKKDLLQTIEESLPVLTNEQLDKAIDSENPEELEKIMTVPAETEEQKTARELQEKQTADVATKKQDDEETQRLLDEKKKDDETDDQHKARLATEKAVREAKLPVAGKLFAGKYKTKEDLLKGFENAAKVLNYNGKLIKVLVDYANKTGDYSTIEEMYPEFNAAIDKNQKAEKLLETQRQEEAKRLDTGVTSIPQTVDANVHSEMSRLAVDGALQGLSATQAGRELADAGITLPAQFLYDKDETMLFLKQLRTEEPVIFVHLEQEIVSSVKRNLKEVQDVYAALNDSETQNPKLIQAEEEKIKALAKDAGLEVKDEELKGYMEQILKNSDIYEMKNGVQFIRPDAISKRWIVDNFENIKKQIRINAEIEGRKQAALDLKSHSIKVPGSISNAPIPSDQRNRQTKAGTLDVSDEKQREALTDAQLDKYIEEGLPAPKP